MAQEAEATDVDPSSLDIRPTTSCGVPGPPATDDGVVAGYPDEEKDRPPLPEEAEILILDGQDDLGGDDDDDLGGGECALGPEVAPKFAVGQALQVLSAEGSYKPCTVIAADSTEMGPMYAVKLEDGLVQSLVSENDLLE
eukprot:TRINITY_DN49427_c0_g1_i1.p1 TRINITY_DN49427_c0_g1~~TRINITY_DN49427_c0_g1_i1.p1  ORF type:complete len:140 (+),score=34.10 TRINITY_DN49427_c0_g1_i1:78-497(+)